jgi:hypothetical protein
MFGKHGFCGSGVYHQVNAAPSYRTTNRQLIAVQLPVERLTQWLSANRNEMRSKAIQPFKKELLTAAANWNPKQ